MAASFVDSNLAPGERVLYRGQVHWVIYLFPVMLLGFGITFAVSGFHTGMFLAVAGAVAGVAAWIRQTTSEFAVTNSRVILKTGFLSRRTIEINRASIESAQVEQDILGRVLNYGTIILVGTGGTREPFSMIDNPADFRHAVLG